MSPLFVAVALAAAPPRPIDAHELRGHVRFLASDHLEGRAPGTRGDALAQAYVGGQLEAFGYAPGAPDGEYVQSFDLLGITGHPERLTLRAGQAVVPLESHRDFVVVAGHQRERSRVENAELVFVGFGIQAPEYQWDDFKGLDLAGKVLVVMNSDPEADPRLFGGKARLWYGRWDYKFEQARRVGAAGCLIIHTTYSAGYPWQVVQTSWSGEQLALPAKNGGGLQLEGWLSEAATRTLFALTGKDLDLLRARAQSRAFKPVPLGVTLSADFTSTVSRRSTGNVLGLLRGSDPALADEVVVLTAHHDHLGVKPGVAPGDDAIFNGAVDNASGVAALLAVARAIAAQPKPPRRSVLIAAVAAEEQGLLGSRYLVEHPPVPVAKMAASLNLDGLNIWGRTKDVSVIGLGKTSIDATLVELAKQQGRTVKPDALADRGFFYRSDQFNFAKVGVPSAYFSSGHEFIGRPEHWGREQRERWEATHYHQPSDELTAEWDLSGALEDVELYRLLALALANAPAMPTWTRGDEFEAVRKKSLAR